MRIWKYLPALIAIAVVLVIAVYVAFYFIFLDLIVDYWWFQTLKFEGYFWLRLLYRFFLSGGVTLVFFAIFFFHFWIASRYLGLNPREDIFIHREKRRQFERFSDMFMNGSVKIYTPLSLALAFVVALPFYEQWETALLYFFGGSSGVSEPVYGQDVGFYLLSYPIYQLIQQELLYSASILFVMVLLLYWLEHMFVPNQAKEFPLGAKIHLAILMAFVVLFVIWGFLLERFALLYVNTHEPVFYGPGFVEIRYQLPLIWLSIVAFLAIAVSFGIFIFSEKHRIKAPLIISLVAFGAVLGLQKVQFIPDLLTMLIVKPNPVKAEKPFMQHNIVATLDAYALKNIKTVDFPVVLDPTLDIEAWSTQQRFENIPVWDREFLDDVYMQMQGIRPYYRFTGVDEDRYFLHDHSQQVNLAAREMNISRLPLEAQNWENTHLRYIHGYGAVMTPAAQDAGNPITWYLRDLNMYSDVGIKVKNPDIYYGQERYRYAIAPNNLEIVGLSGTDPSLGQNYQGVGGIPISSYFRKLLFAFYFKDEKIFFSTNISNRSRMLIHRNIIERINKLTPFLHLDKDPYLVVTDDRFYWIQDAYTLSDWYPVSKPASDDFLEGSQTFNYIRNSVKIVVDAFDGSTKFYIADPSDVLIQAYDRAYPGVFMPIEEVPEALQKHLRYPRDLYYLQMKVYAKYHQQTPELFYQQAETWEFAKAHDKTVLPYFLTMDFGNCNDREEFVMINPMTPVNRDNLSMIGIAGVMDKEKCDDSYQPGITIYKFLKDVQVNGPAQVEALIDQDPEISEQISLWDQHGSTVAFGRMVILPMKQSILYVQPIYLTSTKTKIPELTRVIVSIGNQVVMDKTLWSAFSRLKERFARGATGVSTADTVTETANGQTK
ncbi:MAG: hypothetical protein CVV13_04085 [Gammaproteobacteria bacterium HGW-Gammaproteobacteria-3]|nr:MAG: hypothetical protein CVV13_04085 [Gammaproteobacteria bacterium HGW-Gammaproteobacteria-3]